MISSTRIPHFATSAISDSPIALTAALLDRYAPRNGTGASTDDDVTLQITPPPDVAQHGDRVPRDRDQAEHVGLVDRAPHVGRHHLERQVVALDARVVDEHPQAVGHVHGRLVVDVEPFDGDARARAGLLGEPVAVIRVAHRRDHVEAAACELDRDRATDPASRTGHQRRPRKLP